MSRFACTASTVVGVLGMRRRVLGVAPRRIAAALGLLVVAAAVVVAVVLLARGGSATSDKTGSSPSTLFRRLKTPYSDGGARFEIKPASSAPWAASLRRRQSPRAGRRWVAIAVPVHNFSQMELRPLGLGYRIVTAFDAGGIRQPAVRVLLARRAERRGPPSCG